MCDIELLKVDLILPAAITGPLKDKIWLVLLPQCFSYIVSNENKGGLADTVGVGMWCLGGWRQRLHGYSQSHSQTQLAESEHPLTTCFIVLSQIPP